MEGPYVKYEQVIPPEGKICAQVEAGLLLEALEQMASHLEPRHPTGQEGIQSYTPQVELHLSALGQTLSLVTTRDMGYTWQEGKNPLAGRAEWTFISSVPARIQGVETDALFRMGLNHTYLRTAVQALGAGAGELIDLHFADPLQAVQFTTPAHPNRRTLQMPMKLQAG
jgi:DNA polymerase III sliding clamp (beta) subunit (PCNA family)